MKKIIVTLLLVSIIFSSVSCGDNEEKTEDVKNGIQGYENVEKATKQEEEIVGKKGQEIKDVEKQNPPKVSENWFDMEFGFENNSYKIPFEVDKLIEQGWEVDFSETGFNKETSLQAGEKVAGNINLKNEKYDDKLQVKVGFNNDDDREKNILDTNIWSFECSIVYGFKKMKKYPVMVIGDGITWGTKRNEIEKKLGNPKLKYESAEHKYVKYTYRKESAYIDLVIYDDGGLMGISMRKF